MQRELATTCCGFQVGTPLDRRKFIDLPLRVFGTLRVPEMGVWLGALDVRTAAALLAALPEWMGGVE